MTSMKQLKAHAKQHIQIQKMAIDVTKPIKHNGRRTMATSKMFGGIRKQKLGIKKAIASPRTPKQLIPSLKKRLRQLKKRK